MTNEPQPVDSSPAAIVVSAFGGVDPLAQATGIPVKTIRGWLAPVAQKGAGGRIPAKWQGPILAAARDRKIPLTAEDLIDMREPAEAAAGAEAAP